MRDETRRVLKTKVDELNAAMEAADLRIAQGQEYMNTAKADKAALKTERDAVKAELDLEPEEPA